MKIEDFYIAIVVFCICYIADFIAIGVDLIAGVRKAKKAGIARRSEGYKRTVKKVAVYYNCLFAVSVVDVFLLMLVYVMQLKGHWMSVPLFPVLTLLAGAYIAFVEARSVFEKLEEKERSRASADVTAVLKLLADDSKKDKIKSLLEELK